MMTQVSGSVTRVSLIGKKCGKSSHTESGRLRFACSPARRPSPSSANSRTGATSRDTHSDVSPTLRTTHSDASPTSRTTSSPSGIGGVGGVGGVGGGGRRALEVGGEGRGQHRRALGDAHLCRAGGQRARPLRVRRGLLEDGDEEAALVGVVRHQAEAAVEVQVGDAVAARREEALQVGALSAEAVLDARPVAVPLAAVPHLPPAHARPAGEAGQRVPRVDEAEAAAAERGEDARHDRLVLDRVEGAGGVDEPPAHLEQPHALAPYLHLQRVQHVPRPRRPPPPDDGVLAQRAVARAGHVAQNAIEEKRRGGGALAHRLREEARVVRGDDERRGVQPGGAGGEQLAALDVCVVGDEEAASLVEAPHGRARGGVRVCDPRGRSQHLEDLLRLRARTRAHIEHGHAGPHVEQERRHHRHRLLPLQVAERAFAEQPCVERLDGRRARSRRRRRLRPAVRH
mmetsp:Transcript_13259/g.42502  ORF Transcript_13259/g.42502 Transcript_13259/m.42502 type:complete len:457 (-) Transcript_13259:175-1545(-)